MGCCNSKAIKKDNNSLQKDHNISNNPIQEDECANRDTLTPSWAIDTNSKTVKESEVEIIEG